MLRGAGKGSVACEGNIDRSGILGQREMSMHRVQCVHRGAVRGRVGLNRMYGGW